MVIKIKFQDYMFNLRELDLYIKYYNTIDNTKYRVHTNNIAGYVYECVVYVNNKKDMASIISRVSTLSSTLNYEDGILLEIGKQKISYTDYMKPKKIYTKKSCIIQ